MHSRPQARHTERIWRISLEQIEATVSEFLGPGRVKGYSRESSFSRHVSMYVARHVGGWSWPQISRFYIGRHHTTVLAPIRKIETLRQHDESVDALLDMLTSAPSPEMLQAEASKSKWRQILNRYDCGTNTGIRWEAVRRRNAEGRRGVAAPAVPARPEASIFRSEHDGENANRLVRIARVLAAHAERSVVVVDLPEDALAVVFKCAEIALPVRVVV